MRRGTVWASAGVLLLTLLVALFLAVRRDQGRAALPPEEEPTLDRAPATPLFPLESLEAGRTAERSPERSAVEESPSTLGASGGPATDLLAGRWIVYDQDESAHASEDGWFEYTVDGEGPVRRAEVRAGLWSAACPAGSGLHPGRIELGGRGAVAHDSAWGSLLEPERDARVEVEARWVRPTILRVLDAHTRADLDDVEVRLGPAAVYPGGGEGLPACTDASSPIALPLPEVIDEFGSTERVWARARGYGWASMEVPLALGGEFLLALRPGGTVHVEVTGVHELLRPFFRLRDPAFGRGDYQGVLLDKQLDGDAQFELDSIPEGTYLATVELGNLSRYPRILDALDVVVRGGSDELLKLDASGYLPPQLVEVRGELVVPVEWDLSSMGLYLELVGEPTLDGEVQRYLDTTEMDVLDPELASFAWSFGELQPGAYEARFNPLGQSFSFEVPAGGMQPLRLEISPPATLEVAVVDERSGRLVEDVTVAWMPSREGLETGGTLNGAGLLEPGRFRLRSPAGDVEIWCMSKTHSFRREIVTLVPGPQELEVKTRPAEGITLRILDGETALALHDIDVAIAEIEGEGEGWLTGDDGDPTLARFVVSHPGHYRIEVTRLGGGYGLPEPSEVLVPEGTFVPVALEARP